MRQRRTSVFLLVWEAPRRSRIRPEGGAAGSRKDSSARDAALCLEVRRVWREQSAGMGGKRGGGRRKGRERGEGGYKGLEERTEREKRGDQRREERKC